MSYENPNRPNRFLSALVRALGHVISRTNHSNRTNHENNRVNVKNIITVINCSEKGQNEVDYVISSVSAVRVVRVNTGAVYKPNQSLTITVRTVRNGATP